MLASHEKIYKCSMTQLQVLNSEFENHPWIPGWQTKFNQIKFINNWQDVCFDHPVACGSDVLRPYVRQWLNTKQPAFYIGRGYVGNHTQKKRRLWRVSLNGWANIELKQIPYSRWEIMNLPRHVWKVKKVQKVLIAPSRQSTPAWSQQLPHEWAETFLDKFPGAEVKIRYKQELPVQRLATLWEDLDWADLIVTQSSAISCEAFWYGKKVISTEPCPTWAVGRSLLEDWKDPTEPGLRDAWHEHLAWSQFTVDEWASGEPLNLIQQYLGSVASYNSKHDYNFLSRL